MMTLDVNKITPYYQIIAKNLNLNKFSKRSMLKKCFDFQIWFLKDFVIKQLTITYHGCIDPPKLTEPEKKENHLSIWFFPPKVRVGTIRLPSDNVAAAKRQIKVLGLSNWILL